MSHFRRRGNFHSLYSSYSSHLKDFGEEDPAHFSVFLSSGGKMFCTDMRGH